jgi:hypothetical protein
VIAPWPVSHGAAAFVPPAGPAPIVEERTMPKGIQRSNKLTKKPKKDGASAPAVSGLSARPTPPATVVLPKGKLKNKPA